MSHSDDVGALLDALVPFAEKMLRRHRAFYPFGGHINGCGELVLDGAHDDHDRPDVRELIDVLLHAFRTRAANHELRACAIVHDVRVTPPGGAEKRDAICISVDHVSGYSAHIIYPYAFDATGELAIEDAYAIRGDAAVFPKPRTTG